VNGRIGVRAALLTNEVGANPATAKKTGQPRNTAAMGARLDDPAYDFDEGRNLLALSRRYQTRPA
jgi:hypothetical protein